MSKKSSAVCTTYYEWLKECDLTSEEIRMLVDDNYSDTCVESFIAWFRGSTPEEYLSGNWDIK